MRHGRQLECPSLTPSEFASGTTLPDMSPMLITTLIAHSDLSIPTSHTHTALVQPPIAAILGSYYALTTLYHPMSTNNSSDADFTTKYPKFTKGSWPAWWYYTMLCLQKEGVLGLVKGDWAQPTTQGKEYYKYMCLAKHACFILCMCLGPLANNKVKDINYNNPQHVHAILKQEFEPDTASNCLDKLSKFLDTLQSTRESTVWFGGCVHGLLHE